MKLPIVAIDGPSASGKSSTAAAVARVLGAIHLDSGALYRLLALIAAETGTRDPAVIRREAESRGAALEEREGELVAWLDGRSAEPRIRSEEVTGLVSEIAAMPSLRDWVNQRLRAAVEPGRWAVLDGRDIGTVVFPEAAVKIFLIATPEARAERRLRQRGEDVSPDRLAVEAAALAARDAADSARPVAPLRQAKDAVVIDTTFLDFQAQIDAIVAVARKSLPEKH